MHSGSISLRYDSSESGHNQPVELTFQFLLVGHQAIELSGRYSASKLLAALAQPGHQPTLGIFLQCSRSTVDFLHTGHSNGATQLAWPDVGYAADAVIGANETGVFLNDGNNNYKHGCTHPMLREQACEELEMEGVC